MIRISTQREPVEVELTGPYAGTFITLRRLTSVEYGEARKATTSVLHDDGKLLHLLVEHDLLPPGGLKEWKAMRDGEPVAYAQFLTGIGMWLGAVECGVRGIFDWRGISDETGAPVAVSRAAIEVLMLDEALNRQLMDRLDEVARILAVEGEPFGASQPGSSEAGTTAQAPTTATTAIN